ncbi:MAG: hypothetical protein AB7F79_11810 [Steroidobacteraceae bacterium]
MNQEIKAWTEGDWRHWLESTDVGRQIEFAVESRFDVARKEIKRAWEYSLAIACGGATLSVLALGWFVREPYLYWDQILTLVVIANGAALSTWFAAFWFRGTSQSILPYRIQNEIATECSEATLDACSRILFAREIRLRKLSDSREAEIGTAIKSVLQRLSLEDVESHLLTKLKGARFIESKESDLQIYFAAERCERCMTVMRSSGVRRLSIESLRAQAAGLELTDVIIPRPVELRFKGSSAQFEEVLNRPQTPNELLMGTMGALELKLCTSCVDIALASGHFHARWEDDGDCPVCGTAIHGAQAGGSWDGDLSGGSILLARCENCHSELCKYEGADTGWKLFRS